LIDAHDKGTLIGNVVITKFFSDCIWINIHLSHMPNDEAQACPDLRAGPINSGCLA
jgi:hypothetical protein